MREAGKGERAGGQRRSRANKRKINENIGASPNHARTNCSKGSSSRGNGSPGGQPPRPRLCLRPHPPPGGRQLASSSSSSPSSCCLAPHRAHAILRHGRPLCQRGGGGGGGRRGRSRALPLQPEADVSRQSRLHALPQLLGLFLLQKGVAGGPQRQRHQLPLRELKGLRRRARERGPGMRLLACEQSKAPTCTASCTARTARTCQRTAPPHAPTRSPWWQVTHQ